MKKLAHTTNTMVLYLTTARPQQEQKGRMKHFIFLILRKVSKVQEIEGQSYPALTRIHPPFTYFGIALPTITLLVELFYIFRREKAEDLCLFLSLLTTVSLMASALTGYLVHKGIGYITILSSPTLSLRVQYAFLGWSFLKALYVAGLFICILYVFLNGG
ncbi:MAG: hypothetical protein RMK35_06880 [Aquificaceae bacterium]|nr:hypothetical protein [Aquificaceae bacterium]MCS7277832.1 hypothetical protein [Aquificaceae bacterium]MDW8434512.1 hypothetical protein [Aquificaceae bacterium]